MDVGVRNWSVPIASANACVVKSGSLLFLLLKPNLKISSRFFLPCLAIAQVIHWACELPLSVQMWAMSLFISPAADCCRCISALLVQQVERNLSICNLDSSS